MKIPSSLPTLAAAIGALSARGVTTIEIPYNGSGDEGWVESPTYTPSVPGADDFEPTLNAWAYDLLERHHGGWEINEGSHGLITIDLETNEVTLDHSEAYISHTDSATTVLLADEMSRAAAP